VIITLQQTDQLRLLCSFRKESLVRALFEVNNKFQKVDVASLDVLSSELRFLVNGYENQEEGRLVNDRPSTRRGNFE
jgi:hypothetical protein